MCGICGYVQPGGAFESELADNVRLMADAIRHRGPDDDGVWADAQNGVALGFRRLAILDLSDKGHQPMASANSRFVVIYNGEIYNYQTLRAELEQRGHRFNGHSDTEVMLAGFLEWGVAPAVQRFNGMFAIALWDRQEKLLYLIRDRIGVKPLYYGWLDGKFFFGSELKALRANPYFRAKISKFASVQYFRYGYVPTPQSIYEGVSKLKPGSILTVDPRKSMQGDHVESYWRLEPVRTSSKRFGGTEQEAADELENLLLESVRLRMISDVPLGAFLSGGIDSSTVVAMMQAQSSRAIKTFTIGFHEAGYNEAEYAKAIAGHLGTDHTELYVTSEEAMSVIPKLPEMYDEPFADSSQIPTFLVSQLARSQVTVSLSGDGGDELFLGYNRYKWAEKIWRSVRWVPDNGKRWLAQLIQLMPSSHWDSITAQTSLRRLVPQFGDKLQKLEMVVAQPAPDKIYEQLITYWPDSAELLAGSNGIEADVIFHGFSDDQSFIEWMSWTDIHTYLPDDILVKLDRASMAVSLEARVPLLDDHRIVEFARQLPYSMKHRHGSTKWLLRKLLYRYVPARLIERPKMGFGVPIDAWLRGPLREWADDLLDHSVLARSGISPEPVRLKWNEHIAGIRNWQYHLWNILMFQAWLAHQN